MVLHFIYGFLGSFFGGAAFGPINLSAVDLTLKNSIRSGLRFSFAAALVEIVQATIAVLFGKLISRKIEELPELKVIVIVFFVLLGFYFIFKKDNSKGANKTDRNKSNFINGFIVAIFNPQAIPFWIFVLAYLKSANVLHLESWYLMLFLAGASIGKFIILCLYCYLSDYIKKHTTNLNDYVSKVIGGILFVAGLVQAVKYYFF